MKQSQEEKEFLKSYNAAQYERPSVTADVVIFTIDKDNDLSILLIKRGGHPYKDHWAIPGGFLEAGKESIDEAAARELYEETGIKVSDGIELRQLITMGEPNRDPRTHVVSVVYTALVPKGLLHIKAGDDAKEAQLFKIRDWFDEEGNIKTRFIGDKISLTMDNLAFDHARIVEVAIERLRGRLSYTNDAFAMLKDKKCFRIYELKKIHEAILQKVIDRANFRKMFIRNFVDTGKVRELDKSEVKGAKTAMYALLDSQ
jgi:8-oxo-dGTP diphosphatase